MMIKTLLAALAIAVLSGMGIGSGGLLVIYLTQIEGVGQMAAQGVNLLFFLFSAGAASIFNAKARAIRWHLVLLLGGAGIVGCIVGTLLAGLFGGDILQRIFGGMLVASGVISLVRALREKKKEN